MKKLLLPVALLISGAAYSQCSDIFFSEYLEGSSNNKAIEIYNPTQATINLTDYVIYRYNNGSPTPTDSLFPQDMLVAGDVWVAGNPAAVAQILAESDTLHTITFFNGDDALSLKKISTNTVLDIIGVIGNDPGTNWPVGAGATSEFTLVRMVGVQQGNLNWAVASTEYDVHPQNTLNFLGNHSMTPCCVLPTIQLLTLIQVSCNGGSDGVIQVNATGDGPITYAWVNRPETTPYLTNIPAGTYTVIATGSCGNDTMTFAITEPTAINAQITSQVLPSCFGSTDGAISVSVSGGTPGYSYLWSSGGTGTTESGLGDGSYMVTVTDANGCTAFTGATITEPQLLTQNLTTNIPTGCTTSDGVLGVTANGGTAPYTYLWSNGNTTATASNLAAGNYTCTVTCSNGCTSIGGPYVVSNATSPTVTVSLNIDTVCTSSVSIVLSGGSPGGGVFSGVDVTGDSTFVPSVTGYSIVTYTYTDVNGCSASAIDSVWVDDCLGVTGLPATSISVAPNPFMIETTISFGTSEMRTIEVINIHGEVVKSYAASDVRVVIDMNEFAAGMYSIRVFDGTKYHRILVQKVK